MNELKLNSQNNFKSKENDLSLCFIPKHILCDKKLNSTEKLLYGRFNSLWRQGKPCYLSNNTLSKEFGLSSRTISKSINTMVRRGYIFTHVSDEYANTTRYIFEFYSFIESKGYLKKIENRKKFKELELKRYIVNTLIDMQMELNGYDFKDEKQLDDFIKHTHLLNDFEKHTKELETLKQVRDYVISCAQKISKRPNNLEECLSVEHDYLIEDYLTLE